MARKRVLSLLRQPLYLDPSTGEPVRGEGWGHDR